MSELVNPIAICIWQPKFSTRMVLVDTLKVKPCKNYVFFSGDRNHMDLYSFDGEKVVKECDTQPNGKIMVYNIPLSWLVNEGPLPENLVKIRDYQYNRFKTRYGVGDKKK